MPTVPRGRCCPAAGDHIAAPSGGVTVDTQARTAIDEIRDLLVSLGLMKPA